MVCLGNICRSTLAQGILENKIAQKGLDWTVDLAGTSNYHIGEPPHPRSIEIAKENGFDISHQKGRQVNSSDFEHFDILFAMDASNFNDLRRLAQNEGELKKIRLILNESTPEENRQVPDPFYGGMQGYYDVYDMLDEACEAFVNKYLNK